MRRRSGFGRVASGASKLAFVLLAVAAAGTLLAGEAGSQVSPQAPEDAQASSDLITLTPSAEIMKLDFRDVRTVKTRNITLEASRPLPATLDLAATLNGDLLAEGTESIPMDQVTSTATPSKVDPRIVILKVSVDPEGGETTSWLQRVWGALGARLAGQFSGLIRVSGDGLEPLSIPLSVTLRSGPGWQAFAMVILGLTVGALFKWNAEVGAKLLSVSRKYQRIRRHLFGPRVALPEGLLREISEIDDALARWDHGEVEPRIEALATKLDKLQEVLAQTARLESIIKRISDLIDTNDSMEASLIQRAREGLRETLDSSWQDPSAGASAVGPLVEQLLVLQKILAGDRQAYGEALNLYKAGKFQEGMELALSIEENKDLAQSQAKQQVDAHRPPVRLDLEATSYKDGGETSNRRWPYWLFDSPRSVWRKGKILLLKSIPRVLGLIAALIIAAVGFQTQYLEELHFGSGGFGDWASLFFWGFAAGFSGKAVTEYTQKQAPTVA